MIVADDPMMRLGLTAALSQQAGFTIVGEATDGHQGVEQAGRLTSPLRANSVIRKEDWLTPADAIRIG